jgi:hypothetical protein
VKPLLNGSFLLTADDRKTPLLSVLIARLLHATLT